MPAHAALQRHDATKRDAGTMQAKAAGTGPLAQLAGALNARPAVTQMHALSDRMSDAPVQAKFKIKGGKLFDDADMVSGYGYVKTRVAREPRGDEIIGIIAKMAGAKKDFGEMSWAEVIKLAKKSLPEETESEDEEDDTNNNNASDSDDESMDSGKTDDKGKSKDSDSEEDSEDSSDDEALFDFSGILGPPEKKKADNDDEEEESDEDIEPTGDDIREYKHLNRRNSGDFSDLIQGMLGGTTETARKKTVKMTVKSKTKGHTEQNYTTRGRGRFMSLANSQLGETKYREFIPTLKNKTKLTEAKTAQLLLAAMHDESEYQRLAEKWDVPVTGRLAVEQTRALFNNEIIHRSSSNLVTVTGVLQSVSNGSTASMLDGFARVGMFLPTRNDTTSKIGGQQLSRLHWKGNAARKRFKQGKVVKSLVDMRGRYHRGMKYLHKRNKLDVPGVQKRIHKMHKRYVRNLRETTSFSGLTG